MKVVQAIGWVIAALLFRSTVAAAEPIDFVRDVRPILEKRCYECHSEKKQKSGLRLDIKQAAFKGGDDHGPSIIASDTAKSPLLQLVTSEDKDERMPPKGDALPLAEIEKLTRWIKEGAVWPDGVDLVKVVDKRDHWSFKPLTNPVPPITKDEAWPRGEIDRFILARLEKEGLHPAPEAERTAWLRRVYFDLIGLPPSPEEVDAFVRECASEKKDDETVRQSDNGKSTVAKVSLSPSPIVSLSFPNSEKAYEHAVDRLLASPRYGEHWAQHWLDVVRYADTHGFEVNTERPSAWPYRDYVIDAFNADTPYDRFIREQIVGDALGQDAATGFLITASVLLPGQIGKDEPSKRLARQDSIDEIVTNIGQSFLGLSVGCARCHDHKFDPILQRDYYSMQAFVAGVEYLDREWHTPEAEAARQTAKQGKARVADIERQLAAFAPLFHSGAPRPAVNAQLNTDRFAPVKATRLRLTVRATNQLEPCLDELEVFNTAGQNVALATDGTTATSSGDIIVADRHSLKNINDGLYGNSHSWLANQREGAWIALQFAQEQIIDRVVWSRDREGKFADRLATSYVIEVADDATGAWHTVADSSDRQDFEPKKKKKKKKDDDQNPTPFSTDGLTKEEAAQAKVLLEEKAKLESTVRAANIAKVVFAGVFREPDDIHILNRGNPEQPKDQVVPAVLSALGDVKLSPHAAEQERRQALAAWIADPRNPLTARVMVNRIWQGHFGTGIVETPSDFGHMGLKPTHPELLDWLAGEFIHSGWSIKHLHKLIVLSATYRQSARRDDTAAAAKDADVHLLWCYPSHRLEAEVIRDSMLAVNGRLNLKMHGRGFDLFDKRGGLTGFTPVESFTDEGLRRMIYAHKVRREREAVFGAFDCPDAGQSAARRRESTTPIQALNLFNSRFTLEQSEALAARAKAEAGEDLGRQIQRAYWLALSRAPTTSELADAEPVVRDYGLATLCRALFNSNEFLFVP